MKYVIMVLALSILTLQYLTLKRINNCEERLEEMREYFEPIMPDFSIPIQDIPNEG